MRKTVVLCLFLLCAVWAFAQTSPSQPSSPSQSSTPSSSQQPDQSANPSGQGVASSSQSSSATDQKVTGCLNGSSGNYTLTDSSGKTWQLSGDTSKLSDHVGHKVEITGTASSASSSTSNPSTSNPGGASAGSSSSSEQSTLAVTSMKHIATSCTPPSH